MNDEQNKPPEHPNCRCWFPPQPWLMMRAWWEHWHESLRLATWKN